MNKSKNNALKVIVGGVAIFAIGIFAGYKLNNGSISSIQGYKYNVTGNISNVSASNSNASSSNASSSNASSSNASSSNASTSTSTTW